ncbi:hypothetical protein GCM10009630_44380 [Kribbella jejuensis]|uniref:DUF4268 domain-containing protein n=2 Tax=Kribbella jejuensis TaxID=236068 RepID=A0A542EUV7_9ACTN|nr:hypothetical protein FB475_3302 [Kribbella jejuensis]
MGRLVFGRLTEAWRGEATDFTPLLVDRLDQLGEAIGVELTAAGEAEVLTTGGRRIDIVAQVADGSEFVIENQYGRADHDHLTRGLAYAVARRARGLIVVAEEHKDEFRALAEYLNDLAVLDSARGISVWLVEARAVRVDESAWAPLFTAVIEPNDFAAEVERTRQPGNLSSLDEFERLSSAEVWNAVRQVVAEWDAAGQRRRFGPNQVVLEARGPAKSRVRTVVVLYTDGRVLVPFGSYGGMNSGIPIEALVTADFRRRADQLFGFNGSEQLARTSPGWLRPERVQELLAFCQEVAGAYRDQLSRPVQERPVSL